MGRRRQRRRAPELRGERLVTSAADTELAYRLRELFEGIASVIASFKPQEAAVEETFVNDNARST